MKYFIRDYSKYLGLDPEEMVDEFNEYLFDYTSKLSIDDIKKEVKLKKESENKIRSPYTIERKNERTFRYITCMALIILLLIVFYLLYSIIKDDKEEEDNIVMIGDYYEFTK